MSDNSPPTFGLGQLGSRAKGNLHRRTFLRGAGAALALPWLEAMVPRSGEAAAVGSSVASGKPPVRMAFLFTPNGVIPSAWEPKKVGANFTLPPTLEPLAGVKKEVLVLSGLSQQRANALGDGAGDHARSAAAFLTGAHPYKTSGANIRVGVSVDQIAAAKIGRGTPLPSLELGIDHGATAGNCDSGYSCAYSSCISWKTPTTPMAKEINPKLVFERMFGSGNVGPQERERRNFLRKSILDLVRDDSDRLNKKLGLADRRKMDEYTSGVRELEMRIELAGQSAARRPADVAVPVGVPEDFARHVELMFDLLALAFQTDMTRIATFMFGNEGSNRGYSMVGAKDGHHALSHHRNNQELIAQLKRIDRYLVGHYAAFLAKLRSIREGEGTLLDNCMVLYGSGIKDGNAHTHHDLPILLAGRAGGSILPGRHLKLPKETPLNNLFLSLLERVGAGVPQVGDSTGRIKGLEG
ncbi:MAG TPA: DUF1552 domain-containing protein [Planctomycetaceae bacterium]|jgi:hypothetical protein|nr:DUF1552 domain-containing protein [Planctomycetaceae bacterium]